MRVPLITPLAARDGTVEKDERLVNCFGEQDIETKTTMVIKRAGIDEGDAVISGNDIYGQGLFNYDGYLFAIFGDVMGFWVYVGGSTMYGGGGGTYYSFGPDEWDVSTTYDIGDEISHEGQILYSYSDNNTGNEPPNALWGVTAPGAHTYQGSIDGGAWTGEVCSDANAAGYSAYLTFPYNSCANRNLATHTWRTFVSAEIGKVYLHTYGVYAPDYCSGPVNDFGTSDTGNVVQLT